MPLTDTARRVLAPGYYNEYSKLVGDALSLQKSELDRQRDLFSLEQAKLDAERAKTDRALEESSRAALTNVVSELSTLDPSDPEYARRRMEVLARNPAALYNRSTASFLGVTESAAEEPQYMRREQRQEESFARREQEQQAAQQKRADDSFARQVALKSGRRDFYDNWRTKYDSAATPEERRKVTDDLGWQDQQWNFEQQLLEAGIDPEPLKEPSPDGKGTYLGDKAKKAILARSVEQTRLERVLDAERLLQGLRTERKRLSDPTRPDYNRDTDEMAVQDLDSRIQSIEQMVGGNLRRQGAAAAFMPGVAQLPAASRGNAAKKFE